MIRICSNIIVVFVAAAAFTVGLNQKQSQEVPHPMIKDEAPVSNRHASFQRSNEPKKTHRSVSTVLLHAAPTAARHSAEIKAVGIQSVVLEEFAAQAGIQLSHFAESERNELEELLGQERFAELAEKVGIDISSLPREELDRYHKIVLQSEKERHQLSEPSGDSAAKESKATDPHSQWQMHTTNPYEELIAQHQGDTAPNPNEYRELRRERFENYLSTITYLK